MEDTIMKKIALILALIMVLASFAACGNATVVDNDETDENETTELQKEAERVDVYEITDILGCWYGANLGGEKYLMRLFADETAAGTYYRFTMNAYSGNESKSLFGDVYVNTDEWEEGVTSTSCMLAANLVGGEFVENAKLGIGSLYADGSFTYMPLYTGTPDENGMALNDIDRMEAEKITFTREFDTPVLNVDRDGGKISGVWFAREDDEIFMLELYKNGIFYLCQEGEMAYGTYALDENALSLTVLEVEGEEYSGDDKTVSVSLDENNNIVMGEKVVHAVNGGEDATYTADDKGYTLVLCDNGSFYMNRGDNQVAGVYISDGEGYTLYALAGGGYPEKEICIAENVDGALSFYFMSEGGDERIIFTKK